MAKIAQFKHVGESGEYRVHWTHSMMHKDGTLPGYIRISDWIEIDFPARTDDQQIPEEVRALDEKLEELKVDFARKINAIETAKANLLALTDQRIVETS